MFASSLGKPRDVEAASFSLNRGKQKPESSPPGNGLTDKRLSQQGRGGPGRASSESPHPGCPAKSPADGSEEVKGLSGDQRNPSASSSTPTGWWSSQGSQTPQARPPHPLLPHGPESEEELARPQYAPQPGAPQYWEGPTHPSLIQVLGCF